MCFGSPDSLRQFDRCVIRELLADHEPAIQIVTHTAISRYQFYGIHLFLN